MKNRNNLLIFNIIVITTAFTLSIILYLYQISSEIRRETKEFQETAISTFWQLLRDKGEDFRIVDGRLMAGNYVLNDNPEIPDAIRRIFGGKASIFMGDTRVATNLSKDDGIRAMGTRLSGPPVDALFDNKTAYRGEYVFNGVTYITAYDPIRDRSGRVIGAIGVGISQSEFLSPYRELKARFLIGAASLELLLITLAWGIMRERGLTEEKVRAIADQLRLITDSVPASLAYVDKELHYRFANRSYAALFGSNNESLIGRSINDIFREAALPLQEANIKRVMNGEEVSFSSQIQLQDGRELHLQTSYRPHHGKSGEISGFFIQHNDITARRKLEIALEQQLEFLQTLIDTIPNPIYYKDREGRYTGCNRAFEQYIGKGREEMIGKTVYDLAPAELAECYREMDDALFANPGIQSYEAQVLFADGKRHDIMFHKATFHDSAGAALGMVGTMLDISERKRMETALAEREEFLANIFDSTQDGICIFDTELRIIRTNPVISERFGGNGPLTGRKCHEAFHGNARPCATCPAGETLKSGKTAGKTICRNENGRETWLEINAFPLYDSGKTRITGVIEYIRDVTLRKKTDEALFAAESQFRSLVEQSMVGVYIIQEGRFVYVNPRLAEIFGYSQAELTAGMSHLDLMTKEDRHLAEENLRRRDNGKIEILRYEFRGKRKDGAIVQIEVFGSGTLFNGKPAIIGSLLDVTERSMMEEKLRRSEEHYRTVFDAAGSAMVIIEADTTVSLANREFSALSGYLREESEGMLSLIDIVATSDRERLLGYHRSRLTDPASAPSSHEFKLVQKGGDVRDVLTSVAMLPGTERCVQSYLDITDLKRKERLIAGEKEILEMIVTDSPETSVLEAICRNIEEQAFGALSSILLMSESGKRLKHAAAPSLPADFSRAVDGTRIGPNIGSCGTAAFTREMVIAEDIATDPRWAKYRKLPLSFGLRACWSRPIISSSGEILGTFAIYYPHVRKPEEYELELSERAAHIASIVIERNRTAAVLGQMQIHQRAILDNIPDLVWLKDRESRFITVNRAFAAASNLTPEQIVGKTDLELYPADLAEKYRNDDYNVMISNSQIRTEELFSGSNGRRRWVETIKMPVFDGDGELLGTTGIARDINERKRTERELRESEERFHNIFDQNEDAIILFRLDNLAMIDANPAALQLFGISRPELQEIPPHSLIAPEDFQELIDDISMDGNATTFQLDRARGLRWDGTNLDIVVRASILHLRDEYVVHCSIRDISEKLRLEEEFRRSQAKLIQANKMTSLGLLSSSVAHEINNPNNCIAVNSSMLTDIWQDAERILREYREERGDFNLRNVPYTQMQPMVPRLIHGIVEGSRRISAIVDNMKRYVRQEQGGQKKPVPLNGLVENATAILWHHIHKHTENFTLSLDETNPDVLGNGQQIEQVIINLLTNALQSLPERSRSVSVRTAGNREDGTVTLTVIDEGDGMEREVLSRLSEPFFTTRMNSGGTGLGVYISSSIVREHNGTMEFDSAPGRGTTVVVTLPMARGNGTGN